MAPNTLVRIIVPGVWRGLVGTTERRAASGGWWIRFAEWPAQVDDLCGGLMYFDRLEFEVLT